MPRNHLRLDAIAFVLVLANPWAARSETATADQAVSGST